MRMLAVVRATRRKLCVSQPQATGVQKLLSAVEPTACVFASIAYPVFTRDEELNRCASLVQGHRDAPGVSASSHAKNR